MIGQRTVADYHLVVAQVAEALDDHLVILRRHHALGEERDSVLREFAKLVVESYGQSQHQV